MLDHLFKLLDHRYHHHGYSHHHGSDRYFILLDLMRKMLRNRFLLIFASFLILVFISVTIWLLIILIPLIGQFITIVEKQGLKGIVEMAASFLKMIWEGSGK
jgi:hypothetical protein